MCVCFVLFVCLIDCLIDCSFVCLFVCFCLFDYLVSNVFQQKKQKIKIWEDKVKRDWGCLETCLSGRK